MMTKTIKFKKNDGPVYLEVTSGHVTLGSFFLDYAEKGNYDYKEIDPEKKKIINDDERDYFRIPVPLDELKNYRIILSGRYSPAPEHDQINVTYSFFQGGNTIHKTPIKKKAKHNIEEFSHRFKFEEK